MCAIIRVKSTARTHAIAGAIAGRIRAEGLAEVQAIGPQAVNQAVKGAAIARRFLGAEQIDLTMIPAFVEVDVDGAKRTALRLTMLGWSPA